jgi:16S rRNA (guanine(966)-N(2))-methyltransferase RsmD
LFAILGPRLEGAIFLDLYAGTGAIGIEALSRGATAVTFIEQSSSALRVLGANLSRCGVKENAMIHRCRVAEFVRRPDWWTAPYDVVVADPPYEADEEIAALAAFPSLLLREPTAVFVLEHAIRATIPRRIGPLPIARTYRYGDSALSVFRYPQPGTVAS